MMPDSATLSTNAAPPATSLFPLHSLGIADSHIRRQKYSQRVALEPLGVSKPP